MKPLFREGSSFIQQALDRGFFSTPAIRWLQALDISFVLPAIKTGKLGGGGVKQFLKGRKSYKTTHTITRGKDDSVNQFWILDFGF